MSLVITKGYLLARYDYGLFDEILVFINQFGNKFTCLALGTRKITSKNAKALLFGNYLEIELFYSQDTNRLSKLKKVVALNQVGFQYASNLALITLGDVISKLSKTTKLWFNFYQDILVKVLMGEDPYKLCVYIYLVFYHEVIYTLKINKCKHLNVQNNLAINWGLSFVQHGLVCTTCHSEYLTLVANEIALIKQLSNFTLQDSHFFSKTYNVNWKEFYTKLYRAFILYSQEMNKLYKQKWGQ